MIRPDRYEVVFTAAGRRGMGRLPLPAATALYEHLTGPVAQKPYRLGKQLDVPLERLRSTPARDYRALYVIDEDARTVTIVVVAHRRDGYRSH